ncbi:hypothetical protein VTJ49DRAFT_1781 [Mycothermus thermophilus]|uniref:Pheromone receptor n=1 Tax=Humicola insolens TaxID=85995 RepID=A0ABR3VCG3_HUMIN
MSPLLVARVALGAVGWLESRDDDTSLTTLGTLSRTTTTTTNNTTTTNSTGGFQAANNRTATQQMFLNELRFSAAKSIRTSTIILASFNIIAAFATALGILVDGYFRKKRNDRQWRFLRNGFNFVPEADVYPLVLSVGIFMQSFAFAGAQSTGLDSFFGRGCTWLAQLLLPAVFLAPYIQLVFGVEVAIRAVKKKPFEPRGKYNVSICLIIVVMMLLANFLVAMFDQSPNFCISSLFWFVAHYAEMCFGLLVAITSILLICAVTIFVRLHRSIKVEVTARVAASRMVYYLALAAISNSFMIPFFYSESFLDRRAQRTMSPTLAMVASVVATVSGLMTGGLYLFLKSSTMAVISPRDKAGEYENRRVLYKNNPDDSDDAGVASHIWNPVPGPALYRTESEASLITNEKDEEAMGGLPKETAVNGGRRSAETTRTKSFVSSVASVLMPRAPEPARIPFAAVGHARKRSYSLFPKTAIGPKSSVGILPATTYNPADALKPPPSMANLANMRHRRDSSLVSSATVQIGIRLSSVDDLPAKKAEVNDNVVHTLDCPKVAKQGSLPSPKRAGTIGGSPTTETAPAPPPPPPPPVEQVMAAVPEPLKVKTQLAEQTSAKPPSSSSSSSSSDPTSDNYTLSPTVYSPDTPTTRMKLPSPRGVGFTAPPPTGNPKATATATAQARPPTRTGTSPPRSPPRRRGTGETTPLPADAAKGEWI